MGLEVGALKGDDLCLLLKLMPDYAGIPIVVVTSNSDEHKQKKVRAAGADFYILKEHRLLISLNELLDKVFLSTTGGQEKPPSPLSTTTASWIIRQQA